jgi:hypothetical protein
LRTVQREGVFASQSLITRGQVHDSDDARMRAASHDSELAKVLVQCDEDALVGVSAGEDRLVARIFLPKLAKIAGLRD